MATMLHFTDKFEAGQRKLKRIRYFEDDYGKGMICFSCVENPALPNGNNADCRATGMVPKKIAAQGERVIKKYAEQYIKEQIALQKGIWENLDKHIQKINKNANHPIKVRRDGVNIEGKIAKINSHLYIPLTLQKPSTVDDSFYLPWLIENKAELFGNINKLLKEMVIISYDLRISLRQKQRSLKALINKLNKD